LAATLFGAQVLKIKEEKIKAKIAQIKVRQDESVIKSIKEYEELKVESERKKAEANRDKK
jgi:phosphoribosylcarboxyaminoimidazole (NCAIR) mutase